MADMRLQQYFLLFCEIFFLYLWLLLIIMMNTCLKFVLALLCQSVVLALGTALSSKCNFTTDGILS